jgi:hypothetical protein
MKEYIVMVTRNPTVVKVIRLHVPGHIEQTVTYQSDTYYSLIWSGLNNIMSSAIAFSLLVSTAYMI